MEVHHCLMGRSWFVVLLVPALGACGPSEVTTPDLGGAGNGENGALYPNRSPVTGPCRLPNAGTDSSVTWTLPLNKPAWTPA